MLRILLLLLICVAPTLAMAKPFVLACVPTAQTNAIKGTMGDSLVFSLNIEKKTVTALSGFYYTMKMTFVSVGLIVVEGVGDKSRFTFSRYTGHLEVRSDGGQSYSYSCEKVTKQKF